MADVVALPQPGDVLAGRYLIERIIGIGGTSVVFGARYCDSGARLAIKWLLPDDAAGAQEFVSAASAAASVSEESQVVGHFRHTNVLAAREVGHVAGSFYLLMDWLEGESLAARLQRVGSLPLSEVCRLLVPCMRGMHDAHAAGIVHRDLKPASILVCAPTDDGREVAKVLDFEVSPDCSSGGAALGLLARSRTLEDSLAYRAPEQRAGLPADHRADIYAFGAIVCRALSGKLPVSPYPAAAPPDMPRLPAVRSDDSGAPSPGSSMHSPQQLPCAADAIVAQAMAADVAERFQSLREFADALEACATPVSSVVTHRTLFVAPPPRVHAAPPPLPRRAATEPGPLFAESSAWTWPPDPAPSSQSKWPYVAASLFVVAVIALALLDVIPSGETEVMESFEATTAPPAISPSATQAADVGAPTVPIETPRPQVEALVATPVGRPRLANPLESVATTMPRTPAPSQTRAHAKRAEPPRDASHARTRANPAAAQPSAAPRPTQKAPPAAPRAADRDPLDMNLL